MTSAHCNMDPSKTSGAAIRPSRVPLGKVLEMTAAEPPDAVVYFAHRSTYVKIGCTRRLEQRMEALKWTRDPSGNAGPLWVLLTVPGGRYTEGYYHDLLEPHMVPGGGEWFYANEAVLGVVRRRLQAEELAKTPEGVAFMRSEIQRMCRKELEEIHATHA